MNIVTSYGLRVTSTGVLLLAAWVLCGRGFSPALHLSAQSTPHVVFVTGDDEYRSEVTMPMIAAILEARYGIRASVALAKPEPQTKTNIDGLDALQSADLLVMYTRFRALPEDQLAKILAYVESGRPIVGLRTSTHAFLYPKGHARESLNDGFGRDVFGQRWITHHGAQSTTDVTIANAAHPILRGVVPFRARSWLYHVAPLNGAADVLLEGDAVNSNKTNRQSEFPPTQPVAWTRQYKQSRVFFTTLGHPEDFAAAPMRRLVVNGILWALGREVPAGGADATPVGAYVAPSTFELR